MRRLCIAAVIAVLVGIVPTVAEARSYTIRTGEYIVTKLGPFKTRGSRSYRPTLGRAIRAFGPPSSRFQKYGGCIAKWRRLGLRIEFYNFGDVSPNRCAENVGLAQSFSVTDDDRWRTPKGLRIGMEEDRIWDLYPNAEWHTKSRSYPAGYWLREAWSPYGEGAYYAVLSVHISGGPGGFIRSFEGWIGAAGE